MSIKEAFGFVILLNCFVFFTGCERSAEKSKSSPASAGTSSVATDSGEVARQSSSALKIDGPMMNQIKTEKVVESFVPSILAATGKVQFNEDRIARVLTPVNGQVQQLSVKVGDPVKANDKLFQIKSREVAAAVTEHLEDHKDLDLAVKNYAMVKDLVEHQAASRIALQQAESDLAKAKARVARTEEALRVLGLKVEENDLSGELSSFIPHLAPLNGTVIERRVTEGQFVQPDSNPLLVIADLSSVWVMADIFERDLHRVRVGQKAEVRAEAYPERQFSVSLTLDEAARGLTIPSKAVFTEAGRGYVFLRSGELEFTRREVEVIAEESGRLRVASGLKAGDEVVIEGALLLRQQEKQDHTQKEG